uniref:cupin-like domain-containing protein n=1 Tax=uncultured Dokdonia sp. TaxID=575653 RepID=UPI002618FC3C
MQLQQIERIHTISKKAFLENYVKPQKPVVITHLIDDWPAYTKWSLSYIRDIAGDKKVSLYDDRHVKHDEGFNEAHETMNMSD